MLLAQLNYVCPHCEQVHQTLSSQRCSSCSLLMLSDQDFQSWQNLVLPKLDSLEASFPLSGDKNLKEIQRLLDELAPWAETFPHIKGYLQVCREKLLPAQVQQKRMSQQLGINIFILLILILVPILAILSGADNMMAALLSLPVPGWAWLGIFSYLRRK